MWWLCLDRSWLAGRVIRWIWESCVNVMFLIFKKIFFLLKKNYWKKCFFFFWTVTKLSLLTLVRRGIGHTASHSTPTYLSMGVYSEPNQGLFALANIFVFLKILCFFFFLSEASLITPIFQRILIDKFELKNLKEKKLKSLLFIGKKPIFLKFIFESILLKTVFF